MLSKDTFNQIVMDFSKVFLISNEVVIAEQCLTRA